MKAYIAVILVAVLLLGCGKQDGDLSPMMDLRQRLGQGAGCSFCAEVTADYGDRFYTFVMKCSVDETASLHFELIEPETISGICGTVTQSGGKLEFEDQVILFEPLTQGQLPPAIAPWLLYKTMTSGYIRAVSRDGEALMYTIDDTFASDELTAHLTVQKESVPSYCEIFWNNRRILTLNISAFQDL